MGIKLENGNKILISDRLHNVSLINGWWYLTYSKFTSMKVNLGSIFISSF